MNHQTNRQEEPTALTTCCQAQVTSNREETSHPTNQPPPPNGRNYCFCQSAERWGVIAGSSGLLFHQGIISTPWNHRQTYSADSFSASSGRNKLNTLLLLGSATAEGCGHMGYAAVHASKAYVSGSGLTAISGCVSQNSPAPASEVGLSILSHKKMFQRRDCGGIQSRDPIL